MSAASSPRLTLNLKVMSCENRRDKVDNGEPRPFTSHSTAFREVPRLSPPLVVGASHGFPCHPHHHRRRRGAAERKAVGADQNGKRRQEEAVGPRNDGNRRGLLSPPSHRSPTQPSVS